MNDSTCSSFAPSAEAPEQQYVFRLAHIRKQLVEIRALHHRLWTLFTLGITLLAVAAIVVLRFQTSYLSLLAGVAVVLPIFRLLKKNAGRHGHIQRLEIFYEGRLARLRDQWQGRGVGGEKFVPQNHPYARDLDLFGAGSLFELLCTARTGLGRRALADWLLVPATANDIAHRQQAVAELGNRIDLQESWAAVEGIGLSAVDAGSTPEWMNEPPAEFPRYAPLVAVTLPILALLTLGLYLRGFIGWVPIAIIAGAELLFAACHLSKTRHVAQEITLPSFELSTIAPLLSEIERAQFHSQLLNLLKARLRCGSGDASKRIRTLSIWAYLLDLRRMEYFALPSSTILWGTNFAILIERWRQRHRVAASEWLKCLGEFEALLCLARHYHENPDHSFPTLTTASRSIFRADSIGHPLLDSRSCIRCNVSLEASGRQLLIVSGSNMSGKSTLLRSIGVNFVLAMAGAPVRAAHLEISPMQLGCSIGIGDSFADGKSRFQAEVERLKFILALARGVSTLFLLDELLTGTNSADRQIGAKAILEQLMGAGAVGLVTTHDLALADVATMIPKRASNVHFEEHYRNGAMHFDYVLRPGELNRTNARNIMAVLGLLSI
ncbi:MAG: DNA mismatch repair protein MutS [Acidobacteria bacterium]|nr:DNA mismatch repair protein MutS [Acidobacteriota bacterium]